ELGDEEHRERAEDVNDRGAGGVGGGNQIRPTAHLTELRGGGAAGVQGAQGREGNGGEEPDGRGDPKDRQTDTGGGDRAALRTAHGEHLPHQCTDGEHRGQSREGFHGRGQHCDSRSRVGPSEGLVGGFADRRGGGRGRGGRRG